MHERGEEDASDTGFVDEDGVTWELDPNDPSIPTTTYRRLPATAAGSRWSRDSRGASGSLSPLRSFYWRRYWCRC